MLIERKIGAGSSAVGYPRDRISGTYGIALMALAIVAAFVFIGLSSDVSRSFPYIYLLPWLGLLLLALIISTTILAKHGELSFANPLAFATLGFFFPGFVIGGLGLALGYSQPYFVSLIQTPEISLPWTVVLITVGYSALSIGYFVPVGKWIGRVVASGLNRIRDIAPTSSPLPGFILLGLGMANIWVAVLSGNLLSSYTGDPSTYYGLAFITSKLAVEATFILWFMIFRRSEFNLSSYLTGGVLALIDLGGIVFSTSRAAAIGPITLITFAYVLSGREFRKKQLAVVFSALFAALLFGMLYSTLVRQARDENPGFDLVSQIDSAQRAVDQLNSNKISSSFSFGFNFLAERIDELSPLAVIVSNYEQLAPYEEGYGLDDNIRKDLVTNFIPRFIWNNKPVASDPHLFGALYFDYGENSFTVTPMGDLLRNYGVTGVFVGMFILGILLRVLYRGLVEGQVPSVVRSTLYFMLLTSINYEYFYGMILTYMCKVGLTATIGLLIVGALSKRVDVTNS